MTESTGSPLHCPEGTRVPTDTDRYTKLPDALLGVLTPREHQVLHAMLSYRWFEDSEIKPFVRTLARTLNCSKRTIQRAIDGLERKGLIVVVARFRIDTDNGQTSNDYRPTPLLLSLLPRLGDRDDSGGRQPRQAPMTSMAPRKNQRNQRPEQRRSKNGYSQPARTFSELTQTRQGTLSRLNR